MPKLEVIDDANPLLLNKPKKNFDSLTTAEKKALLDEIARAPEAAQLEQALASIMTHDNPAAADLIKVTVQPRPGFVCKTAIVSHSSKGKGKHAQGTKVYINICTSEKIPAPPLASEKEIQQALNADPQATYQVPLSLGQQRRDSDGQSLIFDACIHTDPYVRARRSLDFRLYILELAMEHVEDRESVQLSREFTMPNIESKGQIPERILQLPRPSLTSQIKHGPTKKETKWSYQPEITAPEEGQLKIVVRMPSNDTQHWTVDLEPSRIILNGDIFIALPCEANVAAAHTCEFYKKSRHLVIGLITQGSRQRYL